MKTLNYKKLAAEVLATVVVITFAIFAIVKIVALTKMGLIDWRN